MDAFAVLADPVRRRILELLGPGEMSAGAVSAVIGEEFGITQPAVSQHLRALRDSGLALVREDGTRRLYRVDAAALTETRAWFAQFTNPFDGPLDALATELVRGRRASRQAPRQDPRHAPRHGKGSDAADTEAS